MKTIHENYINLKRLEENQEEAVFFEEENVFIFYSLLYKYKKAQNMPVVASRLFKKFLLFFNN